jgi:hypothetical protein
VVAARTTEGGSDHQVLELLLLDGLNPICLSLRKDAVVVVYPEEVACTYRKQHYKQNQGSYDS